MEVYLVAKRTHKQKITTLMDIVIPVHNRFDLLDKCLNAIPNAMGSLSYKVYIVDNASEITDADSFYAPFASNPNIVVLRRKRNEGFPRACNLAASRGFSPLILFLNSDVILQPGSIESMARVIDDPSVGVVGLKLLFPSTKETILAGLVSNDNVRPDGKVQHVGLHLDIRGSIVHVFLGWSFDHPKVNKIQDMDSIAVTGAVLLTPRSIFVKARQFDISYGMGTYEDVDYCLKVIQLGYKIKVVTDSYGIHYAGATSEKHNFPFPQQQNYAYFMAKWKKYFDAIGNTDWLVL